ncbi:sulfatase-like hydrolase/transferase [Novipirellula sp. SH528]|uniref:sulfatase-like hydrolase/transferase n=1 Tax=Novipirellula sp. SH528 TaxID=3454466 RepID=UPI003FA01776
MFVKLASFFSMFGLVACLITVQPVFAKEPPPSIIIFDVDDLGWQDVQLNDVDSPCPYETPNIIKLAKAGINFFEGYSPAPSCSPSRAGIITGQHPAKIRLTHVGLTVASYGFDTVNQDRGPHRSVPDRTKDFATADDPKFPLSKEWVK